MIQVLFENTSFVLPICEHTILYIVGNFHGGFIHPRMSPKDTK